MRCSLCSATALRHVHRRGYCRAHFADAVADHAAHATRDPVLRQLRTAVVAREQADERADRTRARRRWRR